MKSFVFGRIKSLKFALYGMFLLIKTEDAIITQSLISLLLIASGFYVGLSKLDWIVQLFCMAFVLAIESLNTAIEKLCDFIHPDYHHKIGFIKDIAAGAVSFAVVISIVILYLTYSSYL
ncbi:diacylglycerol kinase family protein [Flavobacterium cucumis]|mgnify:CR=1 FL=1|uniref:Diacylglycerol kinase (ATP) n=1 Tax=Flavobacterium cucumis TaxID=416016 RepID=A0A1M7ZZA2_9FLAO|nr:diacylglycerol kinase family protein [Flavobacterium cucumis]SHO74140.1 diacylglycerol kinase (ATP) [Flavobacterium cucumis]